jgi:hypothetical protein
MRVCLCGSRSIFAADTSTDARRVRRRMGPRNRLGRPNSQDHKHGIHQPLPLGIRVSFSPPFHIDGKLTFKDRQCIELISYTPALGDSTTATLFTQRAHISSPPAGLPPYAASSGPGQPLSRSMSRILRKVGSKLESSSVERFAMNAGTGKQGFEGVLKEVEERLKREGQVFPGEEH